MAKAIVSVTNDLYTDQRVHKVCLFLQSQGYDVLLVGRKRKSSVNLPERTYAAKRIKLLFEKGALFYAFFNIRLFFFLLSKKADVLVSNDLDTLLANYLAKKFKPKARLVYDSHEYFTEVPELIGRPRVRKIWLAIEKWIFPKVDSVYTVNHSIAKIYSELYNREVLVVRNISPIWEPGGSLASKKELGIPENKDLIILQGAGINVDRGAEEAVAAMKNIDAVLMIVGDGDVVGQLKEYVSNNQLNDRVIFYGKKPYSELMNYTYYADIGLTLDKPSNLNYKYSLPNKVFDYMHTQTAVVATNILEVAHVVKANEIGEIIEECTPELLADCINALFENPERLDKYKVNCKLAAKKQNWEEETITLTKIYPKVDQ